MGSRLSPGAPPGFFLYAFLAVLAFSPGMAKAQRLVDSEGYTIIETSLDIANGDEFISPGGYRYKAVAGNGDIRMAKREYEYPSQARFGSGIRPGESITLGLSTGKPFEGYNPDDGGIPEMTLQGLAMVDFPAPASAGDVGIRALKGPGDKPTVVADLLRDSGSAGFVSLQPRGIRASRVLMVVDSGVRGWGASLGMALVWKSLADTLNPGLVRGILVRGSGGAPEVLEGEPNRITLVVGDRFHKPQWAVNSINELSTMLPGALGGLRPEASRYPAFVKTLISRMKGPAIPAGGKVIRGQDYGYRGWALSSLVLIIFVFGSVSLYMEVKAGEVRTSIPFRRMGAAAAAFLGSVAGAAGYRKKKE